MASNINLTLEEITTALASLTSGIASTTSAMQQSMAELSEAVRAFRSCECPQGEYPPPPPTEEEDPPPEGFEEYDPAIVDRKCKLANMVFDDLLEVTLRLKEMGVENALLLGVGTATSIIAVIIGILASGPLGWGLAVLGAVIGVVTFFITTSIDLDALITILQNPNAHEDIVNAVYQATNNADALAAMKTVLSSYGASVAHLAYIDALSLLSGLTAVFFLPDGEQGIAINQRLDGFVALIDCEPLFSPCILFKTSSSSPYNVVVVGEPIVELGGGAIETSGYWELPTGSAWVTFTVNLTTPAPPSVVSWWRISGELWLTTGSVNGEIKGTVSNNDANQGGFAIPVYDWPQPAGEWRSGNRLDAMHWSAETPGVKYAQATIRFSAGDGNQRIRNLHWQLVDVPEGCPDPGAP